MSVTSASELGFETRSDLEEMSSEDVASHIDSMHATVNAAHKSLLDAVRVLDERGTWKRDGGRSMSEWLAARLRLSGREASEWVRVAGALRDLPEVAKVYEEGGLSFDQLKPLTYVADPSQDAMLAKEAPSCSANHLEGLARQKRRVTREEAQRDHRSRSLRMWQKDRMYHLQGQIPDTDGALVELAIRRLAEKASPDPETGLYDSFETRCADALVQLASSKLGTDNDVDRTTVVIHASASDLSSARIEDGPVISAESLKRVLCGTRFQLVEEDGEGRVVAAHKVGRTAPPWQRRVLFDRDRHCRFPGCSSTYWLHPHHIVHYTDDGETTLDNQVFICGRHHRFVHEHKWRIEGDPASVLRFITPDGRVFESGIPKKPPPDPPGGKSPPGGTNQRSKSPPAPT